MIFDTAHDWLILYFTDNRSNKIWGFFTHDSRHYAFWGGVGQAASFKDHGLWHGELIKIKHHKMNKGYHQIGLDQLVAMDPNFENMFNERFSWFKLSQSAGSF